MFAENFEREILTCSEQRAMDIDVNTLPATNGMQLLFTSMVQIYFPNSNFLLFLCSGTVVFKTFRSSPIVHECTATRISRSKNRLLSPDVLLSSQPLVQLPKLCEIKTPASRDTRLVVTVLLINKKYSPWQNHKIEAQLTVIKCRVFTSLFLFSTSFCSKQMQVCKFK